jgi:hypothetical protein
MVIAADYPFLDILWTILIFFAWVVYIWMIVVILTDVFRRRDIGGWAKAGWVVFMILLPFIGVLTYLITQQDGMAARQQKDVKDTQSVVDAHIRSVAGGGGPATEIANAQRLLESGTINQAEFDQIKRKALASAA